MFARLFLILFAVFLLVCAAGALAKDAPAITLAWEYRTGRDTPLAVLKDPKKPYLYVAAKTGGLVVLDIGGKDGAAEAASIPTDRLGGLDVMRLAQDGRWLYLALGDFFDAKGQKAGIAIVDVRKPEEPQVTAVRVTDQKMRGVYSILVDGRFAYLAAMDYGVFIFDVSNKAQIAAVSQVIPYPDFPRKNPGRVQRPNARGLALRGNHLFVANDAGGLRVIDVFDKRHPQEIALYINPALLHKQQAYNNVVLDGKYAYVAADYCGMEVIDISDVRNMKPAGWWNPWSCEKFSSIWFNSPGHTNHIALDARRKTVYMSAGDSELVAVDVSDPARPKGLRGYGALRDNRGAWGMTVDGDTAYVTYITAFVPFRASWNGIRALRLP